MTPGAHGDRRIHRPWILAERMVMVMASHWGNAAYCLHILHTLYNGGNFFYVQAIFQSVGMPRSMLAVIMSIRLNSFPFPAFLTPNTVSPATNACEGIIVCFLFHLRIPSLSLSFSLPVADFRLIVLCAPLTIDKQVYLLVC